MRTLFTANSFIMIALTLYLVFVWLNNKKQFKGIGFFVLAMLSITMGNLGVSLQDSLNIFFSIVISNTILVSGMSFIFISLKLFFKQKLNLIMKLMIFGIPLLIFIEQFIFTYVSNSLTVRILSVSSTVLILLGSSLSLLVRMRRKTSLPGKLLIISFAMLCFFFLIRIPITLLTQVTGSFLNTSGYQSISVLIMTLSVTAWPTGFSLLVSWEHQKREKLRTEEKAQLLRELFHRTKNNMHIIISLLNWQKDCTNNETLSSIIEEIKGRIYSMSLIHQKLYLADNLSLINLNEYITDLANNILTTYEQHHGDIEIQYQLDEVEIHMEAALPCGLIINELVTNAIKHAFSGMRKGIISIILKKEDKKNIQLTVNDNGNSQFNLKDFTSESHMGLQLVTLMAETQLRGKIETEIKNGFSCTVLFENRFL